MTAISIVTFRSTFAKQPQPWAFADFSEFATWLSEPIVTDSKESVGLFSPVTYKEGANRGDADAIETVNAAAFDVDHLPLEQVEPFIQRLKETGLEMVVYSSFSHRSCGEKCDGADDAHLRVVIAFSQPIPADLWPRVWPALAAKLVPEADPQAKDAKRLLYRYSYPEARQGLAIFHHLNAQEASHEA